MLDIKESDFRNDGNNALVWSVNGEEYHFTEATAEEADNLKEGTIVVRYGRIYICKNLPKGKLQCAEHLCATCECKRFVECANKMGSTTSNLHRYAFVKKAVETRGTFHNDQSIIMECSDYLSERPRNYNREKVLELMSLARDIWLDSQESKNYGEHVSPGSLQGQNYK